MEAYSDFASVYDTFMDETPYDVWGDFITQLIEKYGVSKPYPGGKPQALDEEDTEAALNEEKNLIVELGCGTGSFTEEMAKLDYDMIGIDASVVPLSRASTTSSVMRFCSAFVWRRSRRYFRAFSRRRPGSSEGL